MMLPTTLAGAASRQALWQVAEGYRSRWRIEDAIRYIKQSYHLEDIRLTAVVWKHRCRRLSRGGDWWSAKSVHTGW